MTHNRQKETGKLRLGVVGGMGPASTIDFLSKIVTHTPADSDQDHIGMMVYQDPGIPDRTEYLLGQGIDPTVGLRRACKVLEDAGVEFIAIPCNTAHAFVPRFEHELSVHVISMLDAVRNYAESTFGTITLGLMATTGTIASEIYQREFSNSNVRLILPDPDMQSRLMKVVYGCEGIKAGHRAKPRRDLITVGNHLLEKGAEALILGCTEIPIVLADKTLSFRGTAVPLIDPTTILAKRCVDLVLNR